MNLRTFFFTILIILLNHSAFCTPELTDESFHYSHIKIVRTLRYPNPLRSLYYQTMGKHLNQYAQQLIDEDKLESKRITLDIQEAIWMDHDTGIDMYQHKKGYYCHVNGLVQPITYTYLKKIIDYFASQDWESFCYDYKKISPKTAIRIFNERLNMEKQEPLPSQKILELNYSKVLFEDDKLIGYIGEERLGEIGAFIPAKMGERDIICADDTIYLIESGKIIQRFDLDSLDRKWQKALFTREEIYPAWFNLFFDQDCVISYSYRENRFYKLI